MLENNIDTNTDEVVNVEEAPTFVYKLFLGEQDPLEYYTFNTPVIEKDLIHLSGLFVKKTIEENILDKVVVESYKEELSESDREKIVNLYPGVVIVSVSIESLNWFITTKEMAEKKVQAQSLEVYKELMPVLLKQINSLKTTHRQINKNSQSDLINL